MSLELEFDGHVAVGDIREGHDQARCNAELDREGEYAHETVEPNSTVVRRDEKSLIRNRFDRLGRRDKLQVL